MKPRWRVGRPCDGRNGPDAAPLCVWARRMPRGEGRGGRAARAPRASWVWAVPEEAEEERAWKLELEEAGMLVLSVKGRVRGWKH